MRSDKWSIGIRSQLLVKSLAANSFDYCWSQLCFPYRQHFFTRTQISIFGFKITKHNRNTKWAVAISNVKRGKMVYLTRNFTKWNSIKAKSCAAPFCCLLSLTTISLRRHFGQLSSEDGSESGAGSLRATSRNSHPAVPRRLRSGACSWRSIPLHLRNSFDLLGIIASEFVSEQGV